MITDEYFLTIKKVGKEFEPVVKFDDGVIAYPTMSSTNKQALECYVNWYIDEIYEQATDNENNYGLLFYACGYNGNEQTEYKLKALEDGVKIV